MNTESLGKTRIIGLKDKESTAVIDHLKAENAYCESLQQQHES